MTHYAAGKAIGLQAHEYARLEEHETGERFLDLLVKLMAAHKLKWPEVRKLIKQRDKEIIE
jgi:hypothetical protein